MNDPVKVIYNPIDYASRPHKQFLDKYMNGKKRVLFLGMNPGPWGLAQTGETIRVLFLQYLQHLAITLGRAFVVVGYSLSEMELSLNSRDC